ncbi:MAG TPA: hypothetical protein V6C69_17170 [Trichormus sp.]
MADNQHAQSFTGRAVSSTVIALLVFVLINLCCTAIKPIKSDRAETAERGWSYWSLKALHRADSSKANVVLLGSSLISAALSECDATFVAKAPLDLCFYRDSAYLDQQLRHRFNHQFKTLNLSAPGQIPSDAYLTMKAALLDGITPSVVIYALAPRDFIDHTLKDPCDTEAFHYLSRVVNIDECANDIFRDPFARLNWRLSQAVYLYDQAMPLTMAAGGAGEQMLHNLLALTVGDQAQTLMLNRVCPALLPQYQPFDMEPRTKLATALRQRGPFLDNLQDYKDRYRCPNEGAYQIQMRFLQRLIGLCQSNDIEVILVNMPITPENSQLLQRSWGDKYRTDVARLCSLHHMAWLDQCQFDQYAHDDFRDSVHLNGFGGKKFVERLVSHMACDSQAIEAILPTRVREKRSMAGATKFSAGIQ